MLIVTEPTQSGKHDLERVLQLTRHFKIPTMICINKWDLHPELSDEIEFLALEEDIEIVGKIPFDPMVIDCQIQGVPVTSSKTSLAAYSLRVLWDTVQKRINGLQSSQGIQTLS